MCSFTSWSGIAAIAFEQALKDAAANGSTLAIYIEDLKSGEIIYKQNDHSLMLPASTQKLLTAVAATSNLSSDYRFSTHFTTSVPIQNSKIDGDLYLSFSGDPTLSRKDLVNIVTTLKAKGLRQVNGRLILVGDKSADLQAKGWAWDDLGICYAAPVSKYIIDKNCVYGTFTPQLASFQGVLNIATKQPVNISSNAWFDKQMEESFCSLSLLQKGSNQFQLTGCYPGSRPLKLAIAINNPSLFASDTLKQITKELNISIQGGIVTKGFVELPSKILVEHLSPPLSELVAEMLLDSDNLIADSLTKLLGQNLFNQPSSFAKGTTALQNILALENINTENSKIADGSGLSRYNLISAAQLADTLRLIAKEKRFATILNNLPTAGKSGTLAYKRGFKHPNINGRIMAKTGTMQGVSNLAGFIMNKQSKQPQYLFVILENGIAPTKEKKTSSAAKILQAILNEKGEMQLSAISPLS